MKERIYISGPITGCKNNNYDAFWKVENKLIFEGFEVINPLTLCKNIDDYKECMKLDIRALTYCDSIYMLPNWKQSKGACIEHAVALAIGLKVIDYGE